MTPSFAQWWQRLTKRQRLVAGIVSSFAVAGLITAALRPLRHLLSRLSREVQQTEQRLLDAMAANRDAETVTAAFAAYEPYVASSGSTESELAAVLSEVESAVRESGVTLLNLKPAAARAGADQTISVAMDGEAAPEQLVRLLDRLQRSTRLLKVTELTVRVSESKTLRTSMVITKLLLK